MALKTFNIEEKVYGRFSAVCKEHGMSMSKQIELFMRSLTEEEPEARKEYLARLERLRKGAFVSAKSIADRYKV